MSTALTLFQIEDELQTWQNTLDGMPQDAPERSEVALRVAEWISTAAAKRDRFCQFLAHLESLEEQHKAEEARLADRRLKLVEFREDLESYAVRAMEATGKNRLEGNFHTLKLRKLPEKVLILDESAVPLGYKRMPPAPAPVPDKPSILKALQNGAEIPGCDLRIGAFTLVRE